MVHKWIGNTNLIGWESPILADWLENSIHNASNLYWGKQAALLGEGGSIP